MGQSSSQEYENYNEEELLNQLAEIDPNFRYTDYVDGNCTLQEVISIRQCFLDLRTDQDNCGEVVLCGAVAPDNNSSDPPEMVAAYKLRTIPFISNAEIAQICEEGGEGPVGDFTNENADQMYIQEEQDNLIV